MPAPLQIAYFPGMPKRQDALIPPDSLIWRDERGSPWHLRVTEWAVVNGRTEPAGFELRSVRRTNSSADNWALDILPPNSRFDVNRTPHQPQAVRAKFLRSLPLGLLLDKIRKNHLAALEGAVGKSDPGLRRWRSKPLPDDLETVARVYSKAFQDGDPPVKALMAAMHLTERTAARRVEQARAEGLLPPTTRGRALGTAAAE